MSEMLRLNTKSYTFNYQSIEKKKATEVSATVVDNLITFNDYRNTLITNEPFIRNVVSIRSFNQQVLAYKHDKLGLTS